MTSRRFILIVTAFLAVTACGCTKKRVLPEPSQDTFKRYSQDITFHSDILKQDIKYSIYLPKSYTTLKDKRYPVVFMLHGYGDNNNSWNGKWLSANSKIDNLEKNGLSEMIYVFPNGYTTYYCNYYNGSYRYMDMFVEELMPLIDKNYRTIADREHRAITGYSMGGFGAMVLAEKHPELFCCSAPLSMSFRTDDQYMTESQSGWDGQWGKIFGGVGLSKESRLTDYYKDHCPFYQFTKDNVNTLSSVHWFFTCGDDEEQLLIANDTLHTQLMDNGFAHEFRVGNGGHTSIYWMDALSEVLPYFDHYLCGASNWPVKPQETVVNSVSFNDDGTATSINYSNDSTCRAVYVIHEGMIEEELKTAIRALYSTNTKYNFILLPCDLSTKPFGEWMEHYSKSYVTGNTTTINLGADSLHIAVDGNKHFFACTDESLCYADFGALYRKCKREGLEFEYRVVNATSDKSKDRLTLISRLKSYITY